MTLSPDEMAALAKDIESLPEEDKGLLIGLMTINPEAAKKTLSRLREANEDKSRFENWAKRQSLKLNTGKKHRPVTAAYAGKAMAVRTQVDVANKDAISRPDIFGVFACQAASGVLEQASDYEVAIACAKYTFRSTVANRASRALTNPLNLLMSRALVEKSPTGDGVRLADGCEKVFDDAYIKWPPQISRAQYEEPKPRLPRKKRR